MRTNKIVWILIAALIMGVIIVVINLNNKPADAPPMPAANTAVNLNDPNSKAKPVTKPSTKVVVKEVTGDTVSESIKSVQQKYELEHSERVALEKSHQELQERFATLEKQVGAGSKGDERVTAVTTAVDDLKSTMGSLVGQFQTQEQRLNTTKANGYSFSNNDLGIGNGKADGKEQVPSQTTLMEGYVSVRPLSNDSKISIGGANKSLQGAMDHAEKLGLEPHGTIEQNGRDLTLSDGRKKSVTTPHFTIPARSTLMDATAMTAMIGRVPTGGRVQDPFPVKFIIGGDNLATNGLSIPGLDGVVADGIASGNWNLSCISVQLTGATFTFADGRVQHLPNTDKSEYEGKAAGQLVTDPMAGAEGKGRGAGGDPIGYISTPQGVPCIPGKRVTDAPQQMATIIGLGSIQKYFDAKAQAETTVQTNALGGTSAAVTGDQLKYTRSEMQAGGADAALEFYKSRTRDSIDAIVADPGVQVSLHITRDLYVDYNTGARKLVYTQGNKNGSRKMD